MPSGPLVPFSNPALSRAQAGLQTYAVEGIVGALIDAVDGASRGVSVQLAELARALNEEIAPEKFQKAHEVIGQKAQRAVVRSYQANTKGKNRGASGYRRGNRYSGGKLLAALSSPQFYDATGTDFGFINVDLLDKQARQWARLNFGAGRRGRGSQIKALPVPWGSTTLFTLGFDESARPGFYLPKGYFWKDGAPVRPGPPQPGTEFHLAGQGPRKGTSRVRGEDPERGSFNALVGPKLSLGIEARNFLDAGLRSIARNFGPEYQKVLGEMYREGISSVRVRPVNLRPRGTSARFRRSSTSGLFWD